MQTREYGVNAPRVESGVIEKGPERRRYNYVTLLHELQQKVREKNARTVLTGPEPFLNNESCLSDFSIDLENTLI